MTNAADHLGEAVEVMKTLVVATEGGHILGPWGKDKQRAISTGFVTASFGLPVSAYGRGLKVYHSQSLFQSQVLHPLLTLRDSWGDQYVATTGCRNQTLAFDRPEIGVFCGDAISETMEEHLVLLGLAQEKHIAKGTIGVFY